MFSPPSIPVKRTSCVEIMPFSFRCEPVSAIRGPVIWLVLSKSGTEALQGGLVPAVKADLKRSGAG